MIARLDISAAPASDCSFWPAAREDRRGEKDCKLAPPMSANGTGREKSWVGFLAK